MMVKTHCNLRNEQQTGVLWRYFEFQLYFLNVYSMLSVGGKFSSLEWWSVQLLVAWKRQGGVHKLHWQYFGFFDHLSPSLTFSTLWTLTKSRHFWTIYPPPLVNIVCKRPQPQNRKRKQLCKTSVSEEWLLEILHVCMIKKDQWFLWNLFYQSK